MSQNKRRQNELLGAGGQIRGFPGYRTRDNRSGLDPLDSRAEAAHMQGVLVRNLYAFRLRTSNPFYLALMFLFGVVPFLGSIALALASFGTSTAWLVLLIPTLITLPLSINFVLSILQITRVIPPLNPLKSVQQNARKRDKKSPK